MNRVSLIGNVTRDINLKKSEETGKTYAPFTLAVSDYRSSDKEKKALFVNVIAFGGQAEVLSKHITKGRKLAIEGRLADNSYTNKEGKKVNAINVILEEFTFVDDKKVAVAE